MENTFDFKNHVSLEFNKLCGYPKKKNTKQLTILVQRMLMYATIYKSFTSQLIGWWDNYMSMEQKADVINTTSDCEGVDNLEHFNGRFTNQYEIVCTLLNGLCCRTWGEFRWYKDTYMSRVMELPENSYEHCKAKFIDGLPPLFAKRVRKTLRNTYGEIPYKDYTYGKLIEVCTQEGINLCND
ncbi:hypothetical protein H5410_041156 [Solanum commersonii]|uniref:DUF7746 domain-containing protein n=1 Tax=Solanum commersonii TaxID=4109 RepID=A0A9J5XS79_SOLCO|nr:hypothetical protein H5410_041156 [Solanum commersonii]